MLYFIIGFTLGILCLAFIAVIAGFTVDHQPSTEDTEALWALVEEINCRRNHD